MKPLSAHAWKREQVAPATLSTSSPTRGAPPAWSRATVHHMAFRMPDTATQELWRQDLAERDYAVTEILDRQYFTSICFREAGGTLPRSDRGFRSPHPAPGRKEADIDRTPGQRR